MYKIERELYRHVNTPNFAKQLDEIDIAKQQVSYLCNCGSRDPPPPPPKKKKLHVPPKMLPSKIILETSYAMKITFTE